MSDFTDDTLGRYLDQQPGMREALLHDPVQHRQAEQLRQTLAAVERAMADEGVTDDVRRRVIRRVVWGEPEGRIDVHARMDRQMKAMAESMVMSVEAWRDLAGIAGPVRPDEEATP